MDDPDDVTLTLMRDWWLPTNEERSPVVQAIERTEGRYDVREKELGEVRRWRYPERVVLEWDCRVRLVLDGHAAF